MNRNTGQPPVPRPFASLEIKIGVYTGEEEAPASGPPPAQRKKTPLLPAKKPRRKN